MGEVCVWVKHLADYTRNNVVTIIISHVTIAQYNSTPNDTRQSSVGIDSESMLVRVK